MTASSCAGERRASTSVGISRTGRRKPTSAGSIGAFEYLIGSALRTPAGPGVGDARSTRAASRTARRADSSRTRSEPDSHTTTSAIVIGPGTLSDATGSASRSSEAGHAAMTGVAPREIGASFSPNAANSENGTRNFTDAASQSAWRTRAASFRSRRTTSATARANSVDCQTWFTTLAVIGSLLVVGLLERPARLLDVVHRQPARLDQVRDQRLRAASEEAQQLVDDRTARRVGRDQRFEDVRVADLLLALDRALCLEPIDDGLHGRVGGPALLREVLLDLPDGRRAERP